MNPTILAGVLTITALHAFDELVLVISLPTIAADLGTTGGYGLVISSYILASIVGMALAGKQLDRSGPGLSLLYAGGFFLSGLLLAITATNTLTFTLARILQGIGGGIGWTLAFALISLVCPPDKKPKAIAAMDIAWVVPSLLAPVIGGVLVDYFNWRWIFAIQIVPLTLAIALILPRVKHLKGHGQEPADSVVLGAARIALGCGMILYALAQNIGWIWLMIVPAIFIGLGPLNRAMPTDWWRFSSPLSASLLMAIFGFLIFYGMEAYQPLYLIEIRGLSTLQAGLVLTCASLCWMLGSISAANGWLSDSYQVRLLLGCSLLSLGILSLGVLFLSWVPVIWAYLSWSIAGLGMGICFNTCRSTAMEYTPAQQEGFVASAISLSASIGLGLAAGLGGAIKNQVDYVGGSLETGIQGIWLMSLGLAVVAIFLLVRHLLMSTGKAQVADL